MTTAEDVKKLIATGEGITLEFKRCQGEIERDTYETVCSFSNRFGGDILLGVDDDGVICGIPPNAVKQRIQNFIGQVCNPVNFNPPLFIIPERVDVDGKTVICIHVPDGGDVCRFRGEFYDRVNDSDVVLRSKDQVFPLFVRKRVYVTERQVYPELDSSALKMELMPHVRQLAVNNTPSDGQDGGTGMLGDKLGDKLGDNQRKIFRLVEEDPNITIPAFSKKIGISTTAIENNLAKLQAKKIIKRVGPDHGGHWEVLK